MVKCVGYHFQSLLHRPCNGRLPLHNAITTIFDKDVNHDKCQILNFRGSDGEQMLAYLLEHAEKQHALKRDPNGDTILSLILVDANAKNTAQSQSCDFSLFFKHTHQSLLG